MDVDTLLELKVLTTLIRLVENEPEMADMSNLHNKHHLAEGMLIPLKRIESIHDVVTRIPSNCHLYDVDCDDLAYYHPRFISLIFGHGGKMNEFESDVPDKDTTQMSPA